MSAIETNNNGTVQIVGSSEGSIVAAQEMINLMLDQLAPGGKGCGGQGCVCGGAIRRGGWMEENTEGGLCGGGGGVEQLFSWRW